MSLGAVQLQVLATVFGGLRVGDVEDLHFFELRCGDVEHRMHGWHAAAAAA